VANLFAKMKHFPSVATRYDKTTRKYAAMAAIACMVIWLRR
jgi:transposase